MGNRRYKIVSDGTAPGTHFFDPDGKDITHLCSSIAWRIDADGLGIATVQYDLVEIGAEAVLKEEAGEDG